MSTQPSLWDTPTPADELLGSQTAQTRTPWHAEAEAARMERDCDRRRIEQWRADRDEARRQRRAEAQRRKREGMQRAEENAGGWIERARACARRIARERGTVWCDLVREAMGSDQPASYRAWGALFRTGFEPTGERVTSSQPQGKGNEQRVWRLREGM